MPSVSSYVKARKEHNAARVKDRNARRAKAFNAAVGLALGDTVSGWVRSEDGLTVTRHVEGKRDRVYPINQMELNSKVNEIRQTREANTQK